MKSQHGKITISVDGFDYENNQTSLSSITYFGSQNSKLEGRKRVGDKDNSIAFKLHDKDQLIQFIFKDETKNDVIGSVSFACDLFIHQPNGTVTQWITLFDDPDDDIYDGRLGENDREQPCAHFNFVRIGSSAKQIPPPQKVTPQKDQKKQEGTKNVQKNPQNQILESKQHQVINTQVAPHPEQLSQLPIEEPINYSNQQIENQTASQILLEENNDNSEIVSHQIEEPSSFTQESHVIEQQQNDNKIGLLQKIEELIEKLKELNQKQPLQLIQQLDLNEAQKATFTSRYITKYYVNTIQGKKILKTAIDVEEELASLRHELERSSIQIQDYERIKNDLDTQQMIYDNLIEKYGEELNQHQTEQSQLQEELIQQKEKVNVLQQELDLNSVQNEEKIRNLENQLQQQIEMDNLRLEKQKLKNQAQAHVIDDQVQQLHNLQQILELEQGTRQKLELAYTDTQNKLMNVNQQLNQMKQENIEQLMNAQQQIKQLGDQCIQEQELNNKLQAEVHLVQEENDYYKTENTKLQQLNEFSQNKINQLVKEVEEAKGFKLKEFQVLQDNLNQQIMKNLELSKENNILQDQLNQESNSNDQQNNVNNYEDVLQYQGQLRESEQRREELQTQLKKISKDWQSKFDYYNRPNYNEILEERSQNTLKQQQLINEIAEKSTTINELSQQIEENRQEQNRQEHQNNIDESLRQQIEILRQQIKDLEEQRAYSLDELYELTEEFIKQTQFTMGQQNLIINLVNELQRYEGGGEKVEENTEKQNSKQGKDLIDLFLNQFLEDYQSKIPFFRLKEGVYKFGSKIICLRIINGKLSVIVGGGFMYIDEFIEKYQKKEEAKLKKAGLKNDQANQLQNDLSDFQEKDTASPERKLTTQSRSKTPNKKIPQKNIEEEKTNNNIQGTHQQQQQQQEYELEEDIDEVDDFVVEVLPNKDKKKFANNFRRMSRFDKSTENKFEKITIKGKNTKEHQRDKSPTNNNNNTNTSAISSQGKNNSKKLVSPKTAIVSHKTTANK